MFLILSSSLVGVEPRWQEGGFQEHPMQSDRQCGPAFTAWVFGGRKARDDPKGYYYRKRFRRRSVGRPWLTTRPVITRKHFLVAEFCPPPPASSSYCPLQIRSSSTTDRRQAVKIHLVLLPPVRSAAPNKQQIADIIVVIIIIIIISSSSSSRFAEIFDVADSPTKHSQQKALLVIHSSTFAAASRSSSRLPPTT